MSEKVTRLPGDDPIRYFHLCENCGAGWINRDGEKKPHQCGKHIKLGDALEHYLTRIGITQDRYKELKEKFGLPPTCRCPERKDWLNRVGAYLGL